MKSNIKKYAVLLLVFDILIIPLSFFLKWLSGIMLSGIDGECIWTKFGGQCLTCGGTHFVNNLFSGKIITAFFDNQFLFLCLIIFIIVFVFLHLYLLFNFEFAKKVLKIIFSLPTFFTLLAIMIVFIVVRNIPAAINITEYILSKI